MHAWQCIIGPEIKLEAIMDIFITMVKGGVKKTVKSGQADRFVGRGGHPLQPDRNYL